MRLKVFFLLSFITASLSAMEDKPNCYQSETAFPAWAKGFKIQYCTLHQSVFKDPKKEYTSCKETVDQYYYYTNNLYKPNSKHIAGHGFGIYDEWTADNFLMKCKSKSCTVEKFITTSFRPDSKPKDNACIMLVRAVVFAKAHGYLSITDWKKEMVDEACLKELKAVCPENNCSIPTLK